MSERVVLRPMTPADAAAAYGILQASALDAGCEPPSEQAIVRTLEGLAPVLDSDSRLLLVDETPVAMGVLFVPPRSGDPAVASLILDTLPTDRGATSTALLTSWIEDRLAGARQDLPNLERLRSSCDPRNRRRVKLAEGIGLLPVRYAYQMKLTLDDARSDYGLPPNHVLIPWDRQRSPQALKVFNQAFAGHWGLPEIDDATWEQRFVGAEQSRLDLSWLVLDADQVVAVCVNWVLPAASDAQHARGWIEAIGVLPEYRGRGIADAMMARSLRRFYEAGFAEVMLDVDTQNETGALALYEKHGFEVSQQTAIFEKHLIEDVGKPR